MVQHADLNENGKGIVIGEARVTDHVPVYNKNQEMDIHFPCWLYIDLNAENEKVDFRSTFPESKDHHYLLEELSEEVFKLCIAITIAA